MNQEIENLKIQIENLASVKALSRSKGWKVIKDHFKVVMESIFDEMIFGSSADTEILKLRERYRAFKSMLETVDSMCREHSEAIARLEEMELHQRESEQYGLES